MSEGTDVNPLASVCGKIATSIRNQIVNFAVEGIEDAQIQVRDNYHDGTRPCEGTSIHEDGEEYHDGVIGHHDVGYRFLVTTVTSNRQDAIKTNDWPQRIRERIRRWFQNQRLGIQTDDGIRQHVAKVRDSQPRDAARFPDHKIQQQLIVAWTREPRTLLQQG